MSSFNQDIIDFMNGTNKKKKKKQAKNNEKKYSTTNKQEEIDVINEQEGIAAIFTGSGDDDDTIPFPSPDVVASTVQTSPNYSRNKSYQHHTSMMMNQHRKSYDQTIAAWIEIDQQQIYPTLQSLYNIHQRIYHTYQYQSLFLSCSDGNEDVIDDDNEASVTSPSSLSSSSPRVVWNKRGYRHGNRMEDGSCPNSNTSNLNMGTITTRTTTGNTLTKQDLQITIQHCLQHQERMMVQLRHLLSELSTLTKRLSRRYEDLYHVEGGNGDNTIPDDIWLTTMDECQVIYLAFVKELYRKQILVTQVLEGSTMSSNYDNNPTEEHDRTTAGGDTSTERNHLPIQMLRQCIQEWSYTSKISYIYPYRKFVNECVERNQPSK